MPKYRVNVVETRNYDVAYTVEAETSEEALEKAQNGVTISEDDEQFTGVTDRYASEFDVSEMEN